MTVAVLRCLAAGSHTAIVDVSFRETEHARQRREASRLGDCAIPQAALEKSNLTSQVIDAEAQSLGNSCESVHGNVDQTALHFSEILRSEIGLLCQFFLGQARFPPVEADGLAQNSTVFPERHDATKQEQRHGLNPIYVLFLCL